MIKLDIPYRSQLKNKARRDCGAAVVAMLTGVTVDRVLEILDHPRDQPLRFGDLMRGLAHFGVTSSHRRPLYLPQIKQELTRGHPVVILARYTVIKAPAVKFDGSHYFLALGYHESAVICHDPLWPDDRGSYRALSDPDLDRAMGDPGWGNMPYQGLIIERVYPFIQNKKPDPPDEWRERALKAESELALLKGRIRQLAGELDNPHF